MIIILVAQLTQEFVQKLNINQDALQTAAKATAGTATATVSQLIPHVASYHLIYH